MSQPYFVYFVIFLISTINIVHSYDDSIKTTVESLSESYFNYSKYFSDIESSDRTRTERSGETISDEKRGCSELITSRGFMYEDHFVTTADGYILHLFRIINPYARTALGVQNLKPIVLQHGLLFSCSCYLFNSPEERIVHWINGQRPNVTGNNLGFLLANHGYDVWLGNARGNKYSRNHTTLNPDKDSEFWEFSFDEMIDHDTSAVIDYVQRVTLKKSVGYIGHSQGSLQMFGLLAIKPYYTERVKPFIAITPVAFGGHIKGGFGAVPTNSLIMSISRRLKGEFFVPGTLYNASVRAFCGLPYIRRVCSYIVDLISGTGSKHVDRSRVRIYIRHLSGTSVRNIVHYLQNRIYNHIRRFDHGSDKNLIKYGNKKPPKYPWTNIRSPYIALISTKNDYLASPEDVQQLRETLQVKPLVDYVVPDPNWNHLDFVYGKEAYTFSNKIVLQILEKIS